MSKKKKTGGGSISSVQRELQRLDRDLLKVLSDRLKKCFGGVLLDGGQLSAEAQFERSTVVPLIIEDQLAAESLEQGFELRKATAWEGDVQREVFSAVDHARRHRR